MLVNFCIIVLLALVASAAFEKLKLPGLVGMLLVGIIMGPSILNQIHPAILDISDELRTFALIVILLRAGLGIKRKALNRVGKTALLLSFVPGVFEGTAIIMFTHYVIKLPFLEAGILGFIIAAVSPAVVVPQMILLKEKRMGLNKEIPTLILAGASLDDIVAITLFSTFLGLYLGNTATIGLEILKVPVGIVVGIAIGIAIGFILIYLFKKYHIRDTKKIMMILIIAIMFKELESYIILNSLLGIMAIGLILLEKIPKVAHRLATKLNKIWVIAEIILFVLVGARVDIKVLSGAGLIGLLIIVVGLVFRSIGVFLALKTSDLNKKEKWFTVVAYTPKATVQAAIGAVPLSMGVASGELILAIAVLAIVITAPLGAIGIRRLAPKCLEVSEEY